ncbi:MAG: DUF3298 domain-containing protein [Gammaproteobacteria bacterium]|nr:DUF3298 domain-containing protein [Gammaproteobacteria bacterium]
MNRFLRLLTLVVTLFLCLPVLADFDEDTQPEHKDRTPIYHIYDDVELTSITKYHHGPSRMAIKLVYPQLNSDSLNEGIDGFNTHVLAVVNEELTKFKQQVEEQQALQKNMPKSVVKNELFIDFNSSFVKSHHDHLMSIRFSIQGFIGGMAHPYHYHRVLNYYLDANKPIELEDIFASNADFLSLLSSYSANALFKRLENKEMIAEGTAPKADNFKNWNIKSDGLLITFDEAQVAPYVNGAQTVLVPYAALASVIAEDSPLAYCVKHQKRCRANNLLTGGFIDEA